MQQHTLNGSKLNIAAYKWLILAIWSEAIMQQISSFQR